MKSKTKIEKQMRKKTSYELVETIILSKKNRGWRKVAEILTNSTRKKISVNLDRIDKESKEGDTIIIPGKVLSRGEVSKKLRVAALNFSEGAEKKLKNKKCEIIKIKQEIMENPEARGVKILR